MVQRYTFYYMRYVLYKIIFTYIICIISNSYGFQTAKKRLSNGKMPAVFRRISAKRAKNRTPATVRQRAFSVTN